MLSRSQGLPAVVCAPTLAERLRELYARRETIRFLTGSYLKAGHRDKVLGHLWSLLDPLLFMLVYFLVFGVLFGLAGGGGRSLRFMLYILIAVLTWRFFQGAISQSANCIRANRGLIHEISFPKAILPVTVVLSRLYDFAWGLVVVVAMLLAAGVWPTIHYLWLPLLVALTLVFVQGAAFIVAYLGAFFADTTNVVDVALRLLFYTSPIFYYVRHKPGVPEHQVFLTEHATLHFWYMLNPITCLYECFRDALLWGQAPELRLLGCAAAFALLICLVGFAVFASGEGKFAKYV